MLERSEIRALFERQGVLSATELQSRFEVYAEQYALAIDVEAKLVLRIARTQLYPAVMGYLEQLTRSLRDQQELGLPPDRTLVKQIAQGSSALLRHCQELEEAIQGTPHGSLDVLSRHCADVLLPLMGAVRQAADALEVIVDDAVWPLPTYQELLFMR